MLLGLQRRQLRGKIFGTLGLTNSIRPLFTHEIALQLTVVTRTIA